MSDLFDMVSAMPGGVLIARMALVSMFVVLVAIVAERLGPYLGGMFASLPLYTGPIYLMLALERDAAYMTAATIGSLAISGATAVFVLCYCVVAHRCGTALSLVSAYAGWLACAIIIQSAQWTMIEALLFVIPIYAVSVPLARGYTRGIAIRRAERSWYDLPLRAVLCGGLAGGVITLSAYVPPQLTGVASVMPILLTSLILVLHSRIGGGATAALLANTLGGLVGMVLAFVIVNQTIPALGVWMALGLGLATTLLWNTGLVVIRHFNVKGQMPATTSEPPPPPVMPPPVRSRMATPPALPPAWPPRR